MPYHLLTGATGLLGSYLLRDNLRAGRQMAVVVRRDVRESARQRVESMLRRWEDEIGYALPRPPVLEGDLTQPSLGLDRSTRDWVAEHCVAVLHNAASLSFQNDETTGEPYRSNVDGTRNVLELCRATGIRHFHHVSTAYVCGLRKGRVLESELDVGQESGNDYEKSKIQAEKMVRSADFLDNPTIYRPAIIFGDSATGYTTTFHGFYTPLKIGQALVNRIDFKEINGAPLLMALGLTGEERKNFVPVDWVSRIITYLYGRPEHHGNTYHLTPVEPTSVAVSCEVMEHALREYIEDSRRKKSEAGDLADLQKTFADQMEVYRAYWRDDPDFDRTNTAEAAPHLSCPAVDSEMLIRTARFALTTNFGWPRPQPVLPEFDVLEHLDGVLGVCPHDDRKRSGLTRIGLQVNGPGGGQWTLVVDEDRPVAAEVGLRSDQETLLYLNTKTFEQCVRGQLDPKGAARLGRLTIEGNHLPSGQTLSVLEAVTAAGVRDDSVVRSDDYSEAPLGDLGSRM